VKVTIPSQSRAVIFITHDKTHLFNSFLIIDAQKPVENSLDLEIVAVSPE
jgi:hypothetical protein